VKIPELKTIRGWLDVVPRVAHGLPVAVLRSGYHWGVDMQLTADEARELIDVLGDLMPWLDEVED
jgi:hypothetical protein